MDCREVVTLLSEYLDAETTQQVCVELETHAAECPHCHGFIQTVKRTIALYRSESSPECPEAIRARLYAVLKIEYEKK